MELGLITVLPKQLDIASYNSAKLKYLRKNNSQLYPFEKNILDYIFLVDFLFFRKERAETAVVTCAVPYKKGFRVSAPRICRKLL